MKNNKKKITIQINKNMQKFKKNLNLSLNLSQTRDQGQDLIIKRANITKKID